VLGIVKPPHNPVSDRLKKGAKKTPVNSKALGIGCRVLGIVKPTHNPVSDRLKKGAKKTPVRRS
jgi:hypothetical protein